MGKDVSVTVRREMSSKKVESALENFLTPSTWPDWNRNADAMVATKAETLDEGDYIATHQIIKGSLIEVRWRVANIRKGDGFAEITFDTDGMSRNERPIGKGLKDLKICITFLYENDGGIEIHSSCTISSLMLIFASKIREYLNRQANDLLDDLNKSN